MDSKVKKSCPGCNQHFSVKGKQSQAKVRFPLLLKCGHSICEICLRNILKFSEPIQCKICSREMEITSAEKILLATKLYAVFPVNIYLIGEIYLGMMDTSDNPTPDKNYYIDLREIIGSLETKQGQCVECKRPTTKLCQQCDSVLCEGCFTKTHKFHIFQGHVHKNIEPDFEPSCCKTHAGKKLEYFCKDCSKPNCMDCMIVGGEKSCKTHNVVSIQELDEGVIEELNEYAPKVEEMYRRLTKTAVDIGNLLKNIDVGNSVTEVDHILIDVQNHFSKLHAAIQKHEHEVLDIIENLKSREKVSLTAAKDQVESALKKAKQVLRKIDVCMSTQDRSKINLTSLLDEAKESINSPWFLSQDEKRDELKVAVNEDLCALISDYIHLDGNGDASYKLKATTELPEGTEIPPPPPTPVFPPEIVKDIRENKQPQGQKQHPQSQQQIQSQQHSQSQQQQQQHPQSSQQQRRSQQLYHPPADSFFSTMPKYRSKSGSNSSLSSINSDNNYRNSISISDEGGNMRGQGYTMHGEGYNMRGQGYSMHCEGYNMRGQGYNMHGESYNMRGQGYTMPNDGYNTRGYNNEGYTGRYTPVVQPVPPFPESNHPKQLQEGMQELIYVTHIIDPNNFYVQRSCHQEFVKEMQREFRNAGSFPKPTVHVSEGKIYLVFNKTDNEWQRCRIVSIDRTNASQPLYHVFCIDFGSTEIVNGEKLRLVPHARLNWPPPLAVNCALANCVPKGGSWTTDDSVLMQQIIDNKQAVIYIRRLHSESMNSLRLICDLTTFEHGVSLAHALAFHDRGKLTNPKLPYPQTMTLAEKPKIYWHNTDYKPKMVEEVLITQVVNPDKFWVRKSYYQETFDQLCDELSVQFSLTISKGNVYCPTVGMACVVNVDKYISDLGETGDNTTAGWRRAVVTATPGRQRVEVLLLDSGVTLLVHWTQLRHATEQAFKVKALATECHLSGITPLNKKWNLSAVTLMQQYMMRPLELHVEELARGRGSVGVVLYDKTDPDEEICLNTLMIKHKFAITIGIYTFNKSCNEELVHTNKHPLNKKKQPTKPKEPTVKILKKNEKVTTTKKVKEDDLEAKDKGPIKLEVKVLTCQSPSLLYVSLIDHEKSLKELFDKIQEYYNKNKTEGKTDWIVGDKCCTISKESKTWRRAVIMELKGDQAKVFFTDFACVETLPVAALRELTPDFAAIGDAAIRCHLSGVMPAGGDEWPSLTKEFLKELIDAYPRIFITKNGAIKDKSLPVEMWVYHIIQGDALEPNKAEWRCLNSKIIDQGLGVPDKTEITGTPLKTDKKDDDMISFLTMTGSVHEWLKLEPPKIISQPTKTPESKVGTSSDEDDDDTLTNQVEKISLHISDWLPAEELPAEEFTAMPTYIDNNGVIYLHDMAQQDTLDLIRNALEVRFKYKTTKSKKTNWKVGQPCIAKFYLDGCLYRGRILEVNKETSKCIIHYIDYGNEECCAFEDMIDTIVLYEIPTQAHKCILGRIKPLKDKWDSNILDYIHKSIVEKSCYVKVVGEKKGDLIPIDLKFNKLWINDHLVNFEMARYDDGSVPILPKFRALRSPPPMVQCVESDSGPDYIEDGDDSIEPQSSDAIESTSVTVDWNTLVEEEEESNKYKGRFVTYPATEITDKFNCNVSIINRLALKLSIVHSDDLKQKYEDMFECLQTVDEDGSPIDGFYENKAVAALFRDDNRWYRASILEYSEENELVKVLYVDFGNDAVVSLAETREIPNEFTNLPPLCVTAILHGVEVNQDTELNVLEEFEETFIRSGPFTAKVIDRSTPHPAVKLFKDDGSLAYKGLIDKGVFVVTEKSSCMDDCD